nr:unnamed protein product [Callosobruchus chinensis]
MDILIALIEKGPVSWDKTLETFKNRDATKNAWRDVCLYLRSKFDEKEGTAFGHHLDYTARRGLRLSVLTGLIT